MRRPLYACCSSSSSIVRHPGNSAEFLHILSFQRGTCKFLRTYEDALYIFIFNKRGRSKPASDAICSPFFTETLTVGTAILSRSAISVIDIPSSRTSQKQRRDRPF